jgi:signal transduction histidine kinase
MKVKPDEPTVLQAFVPKGRSPAYPWIGLLIGAGVAVLLGYPLVLIVNNLYDHFTAGLPLNLSLTIGQGFKPRLWPLILLYGLGGGLAGLILGAFFQRVQENRGRLDNLHHEFELQVTTLRHHYKNLALGIQGFANRIQKKMSNLEEHFKDCAREECLTYGQFYQDFDSLQQSVAVLEETSQRLAHTLGQELVFLRALTSNHPAVKPNDFYPFLERCVQDLLELRFRDKPVRVEINDLPLEGGHDSLVVSFDPHIMEVILHNVLANAMKNANHIQIGVKEENGHLRVEVKDNGPGVDVAALKGQLMVAGRSQDPESTHLGLKVSLHLLEKCHGRLMVFSQPGNGALFIIEHPLRPRN